MSLKIVIAGGGSSYTPGIVKALLSRKESFDFDELMLYDINSERLETMHLIINRTLEVYEVDDVKLSFSSDPKVALTGSSFIFSQLRVGGNEMRQHDEKIPLKYGLVGQETCGLGGFSYGMRSMKGFLDFVEKVEQFAPEAWIMNYTNPETIIAESVRRRFPNIKIVNACDMTIAIEETIAENFNLERSNWLVEYYGLNHFGWYQKIYDKSVGKDIMPDLIKMILDDGLNIASFEGGDKSWQETYDNLRIVLSLFPNHIPNTYLQYYLITRDVVAETDINYTRSDMIKEGREKKTKETFQAILNGNKEVIEKEPLTGVHGAYIVDMAISIHKDLRNRFMCIVPNNGLIPNLRSDAVVEVPAYLTANGIEPVALKNPIPDFHKGLMEAQVAAEKLLVDAFFENSYLKALEAFTLNQTVDSALLAKKVLDEFIEVNGELWPELN